jgi:hypothetical protein
MTTTMSLRAAIPEVMMMNQSRTVLDRVASNPKGRVSDDATR